MHNKTRQNADVRMKKYCSETGADHVSSPTWYTCQKPRSIDQAYEPRTRSQSGAQPAPAPKLYVIEAKSFATVIVQPAGVVLLYTPELLRDH